MFEKFWDSLASIGTYKTPMPEADSNHAFGALLVRIAKSDSNYQVEELQRIDKLLQEHLQITPLEAAKFRAECEKLEQSMPETSEISAILTQHVAPEERETVYAGLWDVLMADGVKHESEVNIIGQIADILGLDKDIPESDIGK